MAEQTAQDVVTETQLAGDASSADGLGSTQTPLNAQGGEGGLSEKQAGLAEDIIETKAVVETNPEEPRNVPAAIDGVDPTTEGQHTNSTEKESFEAVQARPSEDAVESPSAIKDSTSIGDAISVQGSEDANHAGPDTATNSETEGLGKIEGAEAKSINAIKKPAAFKSVSVTKNFLAKSGTATPATTKTLGDKLVSGAPKLSLTSTLRPRLVAKAGRDVRPSGSTGSAGPDASSVWNRNKPVAPPPPKHYTDEELKQQYGIQLATRLGADQGGKDSKWADIDDDDEGDWVPESVQWVDGTKSTLQSEDQAATAPEETVLTQVVETPEERSIEPAQTETKPASSSGKTILRPGARLVPITKPGLVLKSLPEKPTQEERPASTSTSKSPWAKLPAIEKASPISFEPPPPEPRQTYISGDARESHRPDRYSTASPAREIEPDTFSRTWRDSERGGNRELFNSQSGRYEPVKASRRLSRPETSLRPSSLLTRPSQGGAERRDSVSDDRSWPRKSISSSRADGDAAGASELESDLKHQSGITPPQLHSSGENLDPDTLSSNKEHQTIDKTSSGGQTGETATAQSASQIEPKTDPARPTEDVRAVQQRLMQERIAAARKRKQEEEAKEEAAKQKRIAARLAALEAQTSAKAEAPKDANTATQSGNKAETPPTTTIQAQIQKPSSTEPSGTDRRDQVVAHQSSSHTSPSTTQAKTNIPSPIKPEPQILQSPARTAVRSSEITTPLGFASPSRRRYNAPSLSKSLSDPAGLEINSEEIQDLPGLGQLPEDRLTSSTNTWQNVSLPQLPETSLGWAANMARSKMNGGSVWGPVTSDKPLGNGAFDRGMPHIQLPPQTNQAPASLNDATERLPSLSPGLSFDTGSNTAMSPQPIGQRSPEHHQQPFQQHHNVHQHHALSTFPQAQHQMPGYHVNRPSPPIVHDQQRQNASRAWREFGAIAERAEADAREAARLDYLARMNEGAQRPVVNDYQPTYHETFKKTTAGEVLGQRRVVSVVKTVHEGGLPATNEVTPVQAPIGTPYAQQSQTHIPVNLPMSSTRAASRFFGYGLERPNMSHPTLPPESSLMASGSALSPPPPDSVDHPVYGESRRPMVHLPPPAPVVKLPPQPMRTVPTEDTPVVMPPRSFRQGIQPIVANADWQQRFNGLFGRPDPSQALSPPLNSLPTSAATTAPPPALPVDTSSKDALDVPMGQAPAIIVLPSGQGPMSVVRTSAVPAITEVESKPMEAEEELWQDREFGSLPNINLPMANMWFYSDAATPFAQTSHQSSRVSRLQQLELSKDFTSTVQPESPLDLSGDMSPGSVQIIVRLPNGEAKTVVMHTRFDNIGAPRRAKKPKNKSFGGNTVSSQDLSSSAPSGVENEKRPYKKGKRGSRGIGPASPAGAGPKENVHGSAESGFHGHARPPRASRGGFKKARGELSNA